MRFVGFAAVSALALVVGYVARQRRLVDERVSRPIHLHTVIWIWSSVSLVSFWRIPVNVELAVVMGIQPLTMIMAWGLVALGARWMRLAPRQAGPLVLATALSNQGFTLGAYLCYSILEPGEQAMGYAIAYVTSMQIFMVILFYPVARYYELRARQEGQAVPTGEQLPPLPKVIAGSFFDVRSMPLYAAVAGAVLSMTTPGVPEWVDQTHAIDIGCFVGAFTSYLGIGLRLRLSDWRAHLGAHGLAAGVKFVAMPAMVFAILGLLPIVGLGVTPLARDVLLISSCMPSAIACVIVSNLFHLDARLASILWLVNTAAFMVLCLPVLLVVF